MQKSLKTKKNNENQASLPRHGIRTSNGPMWPNLSNLWKKVVVWFEHNIAIFGVKML